jgi:hypothetical protein
MKSTDNFFSKKILLRYGVPFLVILGAVSWFMGTRNDTPQPYPVTVPGDDGKEIVSLKDEEADAPDDALKVDLDDILVKQSEDIYLRAFEVFPSYAVRIKAQIDEIESQDLFGNLDRLSDVEMFYWPGDYTTTTLMIFPLPADYGVGDVKRVFSNRRFSYLMDELSAMPEESASEIVSTRIESALTEYHELYGKNVYDHPGLFDMESDQNFGFRISNFDDHSPTLQGVRMEILTLLMLAGNLHLAGAQNAVRKVAKVAVDQKELLYDHERTNRSFSYQIIIQASLFNRQILTTAMVGTGIAQIPSATVRENRLTKYNARSSTFDLWGKYGVPPDFSKGEIDIEYYPAISDDTFRRLLE